MPPGITVITYDKSLVKTLIKKDNCKIDLVKYNDIHLTRDSRISFICQCGKQGEKTLRHMNRAGCWCKTCQQKINTENRANTYQEKYGVRSALLVPEIKKKIQDTLQKNYGVTVPSKSPIIKERMRQTNLKIRNVEYPTQCPEVREKIKQSMIDTWGVENPSQHPDIAYKQLIGGKYLREYKYPSGNIVKVQGYEPLALDTLIKTGYDEIDIITCNKQQPEIWYDDNETKRKYFCDIYIPKENRIIEVKSTWTYENDLRINLLKKEACIKAGFNFEFWIYNNKEVRVNI